MTDKKLVELNCGYYHQRLWNKNAALALT